MRASIAAERIGIPSVSIICQGFERQAAATGRGFGFDGLPLAVTIGHVDAQSAEEMIANFESDTVDQVVRGLTSFATDVVGDDLEPAPTDTIASGTVDEINRLFAARGWSDGSPIIPPTRQRVEVFIADSGHDPWKRLGIAASSGRDITIWSLAVNAVMAGVAPEHLPVLIAVAEVIADPNYGMEHSGNTTGADALMILDGPATADLGFNWGQGALREGAAANTTVGRWLRLFLRNVGDFTSDQHDKATFGNSARVVLAEDHGCLTEIGWDPVSSDFGFGLHDDVVTMARFNSGLIIGSVVGSTPGEILPYLANGLTRVTGWDLTHVFGLGDAQYRPLLILSPILARTFARAGWSKDDVRRALFDRARIPAGLFEQLIGEWSNLTAGRRTLHEMATAGDVPAVYGESTDPSRLVPIVTEPSKFVIAVAGDPDRTNAYVMSNDGPHGDYTAKRIDRTPATDLECRVTQ